MKRIIHLEDCAGLPVHGDRYPASLLTPARAALVKRKLRYDNRTGSIHSSDGQLERLVSPSEHTPHTSLEDVMRWEFSRQINNAASRLSRGFTAV